MFVDRTDHNFQFGGDLSSLTDEQLLDIMQQLEKKLEEAERKQLAAVGGAGPW